jgi:hypothetical protein
MEKVVQHAFVTWAFAANQFELREQVAVSYEVLMIVGGAAAVGFAGATAGLWQRRMWSIRVLVGLATLDFVGEFVAQGTVFIDITLSFVVAVTILLLAVPQLAVFSRAQPPGQRP